MTDPAIPEGSMRVIDFETTGLEADALVIEAGWTDIDRRDGSIIGTDSAKYFAPAVPAEVRAVSHIWADELEGLKPFDPEDFVMAAVSAGALGLAAHNAKFETQFLERHIGPDSLHLICTFKAGLRLWPEAAAHNNYALLYHLIDTGEVDLPKSDRAFISPPHRAGPDSYATALILGAIIRRGISGQDMVRWTRQPSLLPRCPIGKQRGQPWPEIEGGFLQWMLKQPDMDADFKFCAQVELDRRRANG